MQGLVFDNFQTKPANTKFRRKRVHTTPLVSTRCLTFVLPPSTWDFLKCSEFYRFQPKTYRLVAVLFSLGSLKDMYVYTYVCAKGHERGVPYTCLHMVPILLVEVFHVFPLEGLVLPVQLVVPDILGRQLTLVVLGNLYTYTVTDLDRRICE